MPALGVIPAKATLKALTGSDTTAIPVHFNPASLQFTVTNTLREEGRGGQKKQYVTQSSGKLTVDLIFDTTDNGDDVRDTTKRIAKFMEPDPPASANSRRQPAKVIEFKWGVYTFRGMIENYKETIDFFSSDGVPLRSSINMTMVRQDEVFAPASGSSGINRNPNLSPDNLDVVDVPPGPGSSPSDAASQAGAPESARAVGAANNADSLRSETPGGLSVPGTITLGGPVAFASGGAGAGAGLGISAGAGLSIGAGVGVSARAGLGVSASGGIGGSASAGIGVSASGGIGGSAGAGIGVSAGISTGVGASAGIGASASAGFGVSASAGASVSAGAGVSVRAGAAFGASAAAGRTLAQGAFSGLQVRASSSRPATLDTSRLLPRPGVANSTGAGASFQLGGAAVTKTSSSLRADVGVNLSLTTRLRFEE